MGVIYRWRGTSAEVSYAEVLLRADYDTVNAEPAGFRFDGALIERIPEIPAVVNGAFIGWFDSLGDAVSGNRIIIAESKNWYPPPIRLRLGDRDQLPLPDRAQDRERERRRARGLDPAHSRERRCRRHVVRGRSHHRHLDPPDHGGALNEVRYGAFRFRVQDGVSPDDGSSRRTASNTACSRA